MLLSKGLDPFGTSMVFHFHFKKNLKSAPHYNFVSFLQKKEKEKKYKPRGEYRKWVPVSALLTVTDTLVKTSWLPCKAPKSNINHHPSER